MSYYRTVRYYYLIKFPKLFGKENMKIVYVDTDSIIFKIKNMKNEEYQNIQKNNHDIFGCKIGLMEDEIDKNDEIIADDDYKIVIESLQHIIIVVFNSCSL